MNLRSLLCVLAAVILAGTLCGCGVEKRPFFMVHSANTQQELDMLGYLVEESRMRPVINMAIERPDGSKSSRREFGLTRGAMAHRNCPQSGQIRRAADRWSPLCVGHMPIVSEDDRPAQD